ncbi:MAG: SRPBCC family protein [Actinomycetota bacterium]
MELEASTTIDRPVADVWRWYAVEHVRNHPRWDPDMHLEQISDGPMGLGTKIRRRSTRSGQPVEGEMEIVEWEPERALGAVIHDENMEIVGRALFAETEPGRTLLRIVSDFRGLDESQADIVRGSIQRSLDNMKRLMESEL